MKQHWENFINKVDSMSLRERALIFAAAAFMLVALTKTLFLDPLLVEQKKLSTKVQQQQEKMKAVQAELDATSQARKDVESSPLRQNIELAKQRLAEGEITQQGLREHLVPPEKMPELLEQVLNQNGRLKLISLQTLPATLDKQVFKHSVQMTVRGSYLDILKYLTDIEQSPMQMFWGKAEMKVTQHPEIELKLTLYTLSLDKTWLKI